MEWSEIVWRGSRLLDGGRSPQSPLTNACECARANRCPRVRQELEVEPEVVQRGEPRAQHLARREEVAEVGARVGHAGRTITGRIEGRVVIAIARVAKRPASFGRVDDTVARVPGRYDTVEEIHSDGDRLEEIARPTEPHQVTRCRGREEGLGLRDQLHPQGGLFAEAESPVGVAIEAQLRSVPCAQTSELGGRAALDDSEERLLRAAVARHTPLCPAQGPFHRLAALMAQRQARAVPMTSQGTIR